MDLWTVCRERFVAHLDRELKSLGLNPRKGKSAEWTKVNCPLCEDKSGSASIATENGHLLCHQCGASLRLFDWIGRHNNVEPFEACKLVARHFAIKIATLPKGQGTINKVDEKMVQDAVRRLWDTPQAQWMREELARRGFKEGNLEPYHIGYANKTLLFFQVSPEGKLWPRCHLWRGPNAKAKWGWNQSEGEANAFWPCHLVPKQTDEIWLVEGEWDCLVAREKMGEEAWTWTGGVTAPYKEGRIPVWLAKRKVMLVADNDTIQPGMFHVEHPLGIPWAPDPRKRIDMMEKRWPALLRNAEALRARGCEVHLVAIPIDPRQQWGADLRDWWGRGENRPDLITVPYDQIRRGKDEPLLETDVEGATQAVHRRVKVPCALLSTDCTSKWRPRQTHYECDKGQHACCKRCGIMDRFPTGTIDWEEFPDLLAQCLMAKETNKAIDTYVVGRPKACPYAQITHSKEGSKVHEWTARGVGSDSTKEIRMLSENLPGFAGAVSVMGRVLTELTDTAVFIHAEKVDAQIGSVFSIADHHRQLAELTPCYSEDLEDVWRYLDKRTKDFSAHVTHIYGQPNLHLAVDLVFHSALWLQYKGEDRRAWLDACVCGVTRSGKSDTARRMNKHYGEVAGLIATQSNFSIAGLVAGMIRGAGGNYRLKPGLLPINHCGMVQVDEFHLMKNPKLSDYAFLDAIQEGRDRGVLQTGKIGGDGQKLPAAVRFLTLANPPKSLASFRTACEAFLTLYGSPEALARMDFGLLIKDDDQEQANRSFAPDVAHEWGEDISRALVRRAWELTSDRVLISDDLYRYAEEIIEMWGEIYITDFPLFTGKEKLLSLLRVAIACANLCYSHPIDEPLICEVRKCHIRWAREWFEMLWEHSGYLGLCEAWPKRRKVVDPIRVEWKLLKEMESHDFAANILPTLFSNFDKNTLQQVLGLDFAKVDKWIADMIGLGMFARAFEAGRAHFFCLTDQGSELVRAMLRIACEDAEEWALRKQQLSVHFAHDDQRISLPISIEPLIGVDATEVPDEF